MNNQYYIHHSKEHSRFTLLTVLLIFFFTSLHVSYCRSSAPPCVHKKPSTAGLPASSTDN